RRPVPPGARRAGVTPPGRPLRPDSRGFSTLGANRAYARAGLLPFYGALLLTRESVQGAEDRSGGCLHPEEVGVQRSGGRHRQDALDPPDTHGLADVVAD